MDHFSLVYDVCRAALAGDKAEGVRTVRKLRKALAEAGDSDGAELLARLIKSFNGKSSAPVVHFVQSASAPATPEESL
jgi:hypothetical protein